MKINKSISLCCIASALISFSACTTSTKPVERESITYKVVTDNLETRMPGTFMKVGNYLVWEDPFAKDRFMHVVDPQSGKEVDTMGDVGQGPEEFTTPAISKTFDNRVFVYDLNTKRQAFYSVDRLVSNQSPFTRYIDNTDLDATDKININDDQFIIIEPAEMTIFKYVNKTDTIAFGSQLIDGENIDNRFTINQGRIQYNPKRDKFVFASSSLPAIRIYSINKGDIAEEYRSTIPDNAYSFVGGGVKIDRNRKASLDMSLTKDYIVTIQRDYEKDNTDESTVGMDFSKNATTLFLYDYNGSLKKIVDTGMPILRLAGDAENNTVYVVGVNPEFVIAQVAL
ncbi:MAG: hypothetical protein ACRCS7_06915 [Tannerellaceae bacterium]